MKNVIKKYKVIEIIIILTVILFATVPFFLTKGVITGAGEEDWAFHFARIRSMLGAIHAHSLPVNGNFLDFATQGLGVNAMYPYFSLYLFIWPLLLPIKFRISVFIFALLFNLYATINIWGLVNEFTKKAWIKFSITVLYLFNNYHLILMYKRFALGELIGYIMLPLVAWGMIKIWKRQKLGIILLALGVSLTVNSHILSTLFILFSLVIIELVRIIIRKINWREIQYLCLAAILTIPMSAVTIYNFLTLSMNNKYVTPTIIVPLSNSSIYPGIYWSDLRHLFNPIALTSLNVRTWNVGAIIVIMAVASIIFLIVKRDKNDIYYISVGIIGLLLVISTFNIVSWGFTEQVKLFSAMKVIQFIGRLLMMAVIFLIIPIMRAMIKIELPLYKVIVNIAILLLLISGGMAIYKTADSHKDFITAEILDKGINNQIFITDYFPEAKLNESMMTASVRVSHSYIAGPVTFGWSTPTYNSANYNLIVESKIAKRYVPTPVVAYKGFNYKVKVNNEQVKWRIDPGYGTIALDAKSLKNKKSAKLSVEMKPLKFELVATIIATISYIGALIYLVCFRRK